MLIFFFLILVFSLFRSVCKFYKAVKRILRNKVQTQQYYCFVFVWQISKIYYKTVIRNNDSDFTIEHHKSENLEGETLHKTLFALSR